MSRGVMQDGFKGDGMQPAIAGVTVSFGERFQASDQFDAIFKTGMALVERTAKFLDGEGRAEAKRMKPPLTALYAAESMRLTTRLLELASWLLIRRSLKEGEITESEARAKRARVQLQTLSRPSHIKSFSELPAGLQALIEESFALQDRIIQLDRAMERAPVAHEAGLTVSNPVAHQLEKLEAAFGTLRRA